ncbi:lipase [Saccharopolyspora spinosa]|uniref:lipase n=1 Tax=Saccharopolyspora spinosa TaxID=60894 RepID=UPI000237A0F5|nr:lipase [Saccharopolyspora spinosa]
MWPLLLEKLKHLACGVGGTEQPLKVMVVDDSLSQGYEGDWTWRYRLWQWFSSQHINVDFVGPDTGTRPEATPSAPKPPPLQGDAGPAEEPQTTGMKLNVGTDGQVDWVIARDLLADGLIAPSQHSDLVSQCEYLCVLRRRRSSEQG